MLTIMTNNILPWMDTFTNIMCVNVFLFFIPLSINIRISHFIKYIWLPQILVNCGAKLPSLSDALSESTTDELARGLIRFHWYKAATSPALILLTEANPFGRAFQLAFELNRSGYEPRPRFVFNKPSSINKARYR